MIRIDKERIIKELGLRSTGTKGWLYGIECPFCNRKDKFGIILSETGVSSFNCFRSSCGEKGTILKLLKKINRLDLIRKQEIVLTEKLENNLNKKLEIDYDYTLPLKSKPLGFKRVNQDDYLDLRGFTKEQYDIFNVGIASLEPRLKDKYIIFLIIEDGECKGYVARSKRSKEWHKRNEERAKKGLEKLVLRYNNSKNTDFEKILLGFEEIKKGITKTVILVEGLTDKANTDRKLDLYDQDEVKCCCTFGTKISGYQIKRLLDKEIENIILLYDYNTIKKMQQYGLDLSNHFNTKLGEIKWENTDPGSMSFEQFVEVFDNLKDPLDYNINRLEKKMLKI